jgi:hypothetical protein
MQELYVPAKGSASQKCQSLPFAIHNIQGKLLNSSLVNNRDGVTSPNNFVSSFEIKSSDFVHLTID